MLIGNHVSFYDSKGNGNRHWHYDEHATVAARRKSDAATSKENQAWYQLPWYVHAYQIHYIIHGT